jgi:hypothetical protein
MDERARPTISQIRDLATVTVPVGGAFLGLGRAGSYEAAKRGDLPTIRVGGRLLVPVATLLRMVGVQPDRAVHEAADA